MKTAFCFDFDGTVTKQELLPLIAHEVNLYEEIRLLTQLTLSGMIPFQSSFKLRVRLLASVPTHRVSTIAAKVDIDPELLGFIRENAERCFIVTGNLDVWIGPVISQRLGCGYFSSTAEMDGEKLVGVASILNKGDAVCSLRGQFDRIVAIGDSMNDCSMFEQADVGVAYGGIHEPVNSLVKLSNYVVYQPTALVRLLTNLV